MKEVLHMVVQNLPFTGAKCGVCSVKQCLGGTGD